MLLDEQTDGLPIQFAITNRLPVIDLERGCRLIHELACDMPLNGNCNDMRMLCSYMGSSAAFATLDWVKGVN